MKEIKASRETTFVHHLSFFSSLESLLFLLSRSHLRATKTCGLDQLGLSPSFSPPFLVLFSHTARCSPSGAWSLLSSCRQGLITNAVVSKEELHAQLAFDVHDPQNMALSMSAINGTWRRTGCTESGGKCLQIVGLHLKTLAMHFHRGPIYLFIVQAVVEFFNLPVVEALLDVFVVRVVCFTSGCTRHTITLTNSFPPLSSIHSFPPKHQEWAT